MSCAFLSSANLAAVVANFLEVNALLRIERLPAKILRLLPQDDLTISVRSFFLKLGGLVLAQHAPALMRALEGFGDGEESAGLFFDRILLTVKFGFGLHIVKR